MFYVLLNIEAMQLDIEKRLIFYDIHFYMLLGVLVLISR